MNLLDYAVHRRVNPNIDLTSLITSYEPETNYVIKVKQYQEPKDQSMWVFKLPLNIPLPLVNDELRHFFNAEHEHYSVSVVSCKDDDKLLHNLCAELGA